MVAYRTYLCDSQGGIRAPDRTPGGVDGLGGRQNRRDAKQICAGDYFIVGMPNSAPSLMPDGQRAVTVFVLV